MKTIRLENPNSEFMKIRQYVVEEILRGGNMPRQIPSTRKLAQMFGVSHPTVLKALQDLAEGGHLLSCKSGGYLTVPGSFGNWGRPKIIGVVNGAGNYVLYDKSILLDSTPFLIEILGRSGNFFAQNIYFQGKPETAAGTIRNYNLDGLIWMFPPERYAGAVRELRESGLPIVEFGPVSGSASGARWNFEEDYYRIMSRILDEGREHPLILSNAYPLDLYMNGFRRACREHDFPFDRCLVIQGPPEEMIRQLKQFLDYGLNFDAVFLEGRFGGIWQFLEENLPGGDKCRLFCREYELYADTRFSGYVVKRKNGDPAKLLADNFLRQMESPADAPVISTEVEIELVLYRDGSPVPAAGPEPSGGSGAKPSLA